MSGVSPSGFTRKRLVDIKAELENAIRAIMGEEIEFTPETRFGQTCNPE